MDNPYSYQIDTGLGIFFAIYMMLVVAVYVITAIGLWKMYVKADRPGWAAIIPVYNWWVWIEIIGRPRWWFWVLVASILLSWFPVVSMVLGVAMFVLYLLACLDMAKRFGQGTGYGIGLWLLPFVFAPILGFGSARFEGGDSGHTTTSWQAVPENTIVPPPPAPPVAPVPLMTAPAPLGMPPAAADSMPSAPPAPTPAAPTPTGLAESIPTAPMPPAPAESTAMPSSTAPAATTTPSDGAGSPPPYTLAPAKSPVAPLGSWPPAPPKR